MIRRRPSPALPALLVTALVVAGCRSGDGVELGLAEVTADEVVQTVAAVAELEPAARIAVTAPLAGEIAELYVRDGDVVAAGDPIARLTSASLDQQIAQAQAAVDAADALAGASGAGGLDLSPVIGAFRSQLDGTLPPLLDGLAALVAALPEGEARVEAEERLATARSGYQDASAQLRRAQQQSSAQARAATEAQEAAAAAQRRQAELALEAAEGRTDALVVVAPIGGVVELGSTGASGGNGLGGLGGLAGGLPSGLGDLGDGGDLSALLGEQGAAGGGAGAAGGSTVAVGTDIGAGGTLATIYDLSSFTARVEVDGIDVVEVEEGQDVTVLVDAFPDAEIGGRVAHVALAPTSTMTGGPVFPVRVELTGVPDDVRLRIGLTASAEIVVRRVDAEAVVPTSALLRRGGQEVVFVVDGEVLREVPVTVVALGEATAALDGDVRAGDVVVTTGVETVADGDRAPRP